METMIKKQYGAISLMTIVADFPMDWDTSGATHVRVSLPDSVQNRQWMQENGYQLVDCTLDVTIRLKTVSADLQKAIRLEPVLTCDYKEEIKQLAKRNFVRDRRFHVETEYCPEVAAQIIDGWVEEIPACYACIYKGNLIGFLALKEAEDGNSAHIHLAAVEERYRSSGAAMSLYAKAVQTGIEQGYQSITGTISCYNPAVMNLYAYLGGTFSNPQDIYLRN